ncbi:MAG TPA: hypothetical protein DCQ93_00760 [Bacteroidetes bacterium]|nr:hypothetical protein [Bacteroidota bacterium]
MKQYFNQGDKVTLIHTKEIATVRRIANGMVYVDLDGDEIPVYTEDISLLQAGHKSEHHPRNNNQPVQLKQKQNVPVEKIVSLENGLSLVMEPFTNQEQKNALSVFIHNGFGFAVHFSILIDFADGSSLNHEGLLAAKSKKQLFSFEEDKLNEKPNIYLSTWKVKGDENETEMRIRATSHFKKKRKFSGFDSEVFVYEIFMEWPGRRSEIERHSISKEELKTLIEQNKISEYQQSADMKTGGTEEIDLHAGSLGINERELSAGEILNKQLSVFKNVLNRAMVNKRDRLIVIHGYGKGKLKNEISRILDEEYPSLIYRNEYHHRYGNGASFIDL